MENRIGRWLVPTLLLAGLLMSFHPMLLSGFTRMQTDPGDTIFNFYLLEHSFRWLAGSSAHPSFWNAPFFHPTPNVTAYSDVLIGAGPLYWLLRALGLGEWPSYQAWILSMSALNFFAMLLLLRKGLKLNGAATALGSFLFAFSISRVHQAAHQQLFPHFFLPLMAYSLVRLRELADPIKAAPWVLLFFCSATLQLYAGFYLGWMTALGLLLWTAAALLTAPTRKQLRTISVRLRWPLAISAGVALLALYPLASHYLLAAKEVGVRALAQVKEPKIQSWLYMGGQSWLYFWQEQVQMFKVIDGNEHRIGTGLITLGLSVQGLWRSRKHPWLGVLGGASLALVLLTTSFPGKFYLWPYVFPWIPGAEAVRALTRIALLLLFPLSIGLALRFNSFSWARRRDRWLAPLLGLLVVLEQGTTTVSFDRVEWDRQVAQISAQIGNSCTSFYRMPGEDWTSDELRTLWAALRLGAREIPTINGYSGNTPRGWFTGAVGPEARRREFDRWVVTHKLDPATTCWIQ